jgi:hypothetical protein
MCLKFQLTMASTSASPSLGHCKNCPNVLFLLVVLGYRRSMRTASFHLLRFLIASFLIVSLATAQNQPPRKLVIRKGVVLQFEEFLQDLSSETAKVGDVIPLRLRKPLIIDGVTVSSAGTPAEGRVTKARPMDDRHSGQLEWKVEKIQGIKLPSGGLAARIVSSCGREDPSICDGMLLHPLRDEHVAEIVVTGVEIVILAPILAIQLPVSLAMAITKGGFKQSCYEHHQPPMVDLQVSKSSKIDY